MIFDHIVKYNDVRYMAGEDVPIEEEKKPTQEFEQSHEADADNADEVVQKRRGRPATKRE